MQNNDENDRNSNSIKNVMISISNCFVAFYSFMSVLFSKLWGVIIGANHIPGQNVWSKVKKSSKIGQNQKTLVSTFAYFLTAIAISLIPGTETGH